MKKAKPTLMSKMNLREQFEKETRMRFEAGQPDFPYLTSYEDWLLLRCTKQAEELERLQKRDCSASIELCFNDGTDHFERESLKIVGIGVPDNIYIVESQTVTKALAERDKLQRRIDEVNNIEYHIQGMGCGLEDIGVTDRYDAMAHGWDEVMESVGRTLNVELEADDE